MGRFIIVIFLWLFTSCECMVESSGFVKDAATHLPIENVHVEAFTKRKNKSTDAFRETETDSAGYFEVGRLVGSAFSKCPDVVVELSKDGYVTKEVVNAWNDTIYLEK